MATETTDLKKADPTGTLARPSWIPTGDRTGTEHMTKADMKLPRLALAQGLSPQLQALDPKYIPGLSPGMMFNDMTNEIYGIGPIEFFIVRADPPRWMEFNPRDEGGGIKDMNVPAGDERTLFHGDVPPVATQFYDYFLLLNHPAPRQKELIALSMKSSSLKVARQLNGLIALRNAPIYMCKFTVSAGQEKNAKGVFAQYVVKNAGWADSPEEANALRETFEMLKDKQIDVNREAGDDVGAAAGNEPF